MINRMDRRMEVGKQMSLLQKAWYNLVNRDGEETAHLRFSQRVISMWTMWQEKRRQ